MSVVSTLCTGFILWLTLLLPAQATVHPFSEHHRQTSKHHRHVHEHQHAREDDDDCDRRRACGRWFIVPQPYRSGQNVQGVDPATGVLRYTQQDIAPLPSGLGLRRFYQSSAWGQSWKHQYQRRLTRHLPIHYKHTRA